MKLFTISASSSIILLSLTFICLGKLIFLTLLFKNLVSKFKNKSYNITETNKFDKTLFLKPVNNSEIIIQISKLKNGKSPGIDGISVDILKNM